MLIIPPTIQLLVYGFALNPDVHHLKLGVVDYAQTKDSRELVSALSENQIFDVKSVSLNESELARQVETGKLNVGMVIPPAFSCNLTSDKSAPVQVLIDGVDANTAGIASGYINQMVQQFGLQYVQTSTTMMTPPINTQVVFLYNQGLTSSWFFVPGVNRHCAWHFAQRCGH